MDSNFNAEQDHNHGLEHIIHYTPRERQQIKLHRLVSEMMANDAFVDDEYKSVLGMFYTLIENGRISELYNVLKVKFPEYYK